MTAQDPCMSVGYSPSHEKSLETVVGQLGEIIAKEFEIVLESTEIVLSAKSMDCYEMAGKGVAGPESELRLKHPMLPLGALIESPGIVVSGCV